MKHLFYSKVIDGKLTRHSAKHIAECLDSFEGVDVCITIEKKKRKRSNEQNRYLHMLFTLLKDSLNDLGNDFQMEEVKELCKAKFSLIDVVNENTGEVIGQRIKGTSEMSTFEMVQFIESVIRWAADMFGIILPYPNENICLSL